MPVVEAGNRIQAGSARNLHDDQRDAQSLANMHERGRQREGDAQIYQRRDDAGKYVQRRVHRLHADDEVAGGDYKPNSYKPKERSEKEWLELMEDEEGANNGTASLGLEE